MVTSVDPPDILLLSLEYMDFFDKSHCSLITSLEKSSDAKEAQKGQRRHQTTALVG